MLAYFLILLGFSMRFIFTELPNFAPIAAIALFSGVYLNRKIAPWIPLLIMITSDLVIGMHDMVLFTWGAFMIIGFVGIKLKEKRDPASILMMTVLSSIFFFAVTNFGVWLVWYPRTVEGLLNCYMMALPFLRNTLAGNVLFAVIVFGLYEIVARVFEKSRYKSLILAN